MQCAYPLPSHLCWNVFHIDSNTISFGNRVHNCLSVVENVTSDEKYKRVIWNDLVRCSRMASESVSCESFRRSFLGVLYLYIWYSHAIIVSNGWIRDSRLCGLFSVE